MTPRDLTMLSLGAAVILGLCALSEWLRPVWAV